MFLAVLAVIGAFVGVLREMTAAESPAPTGARSTPPAATAPVKARVAAIAMPRIAPIDRTPAGSVDGQADEDRAGPESTPSLEDIRDHMEAAFGADPLAASQDLVQGLDREVRSVLPTTSSVHRIECRSSLCRIETVHPSLGEFRDFAQLAFFAHDPKVGNGPVFVGLLAEPAPGEPVIAVAYVGRQGSVLPMPASVARRNEH
jgi:hypothetical protein